MMTSSGRAAVPSKVLHANHLPDDGIDELLSFLGAFGKIEFGTSGFVAAARVIVAVALFSVHTTVSTLWALLSH